jgi:endonuclease-3
MRIRLMSRSTEHAPSGYTRAALRKKTALVSRLLEAHMGVPERRRPLPDPLDMLIATILSQNTNDKNSHRAYTELRRRFPSWDLVAAARRSAIRSAIRSGGMVNQKSSRIREALEAVRIRYGKYDLSPLKRKSSDRVITELTGLKGVGAKTAACVLLFSLGRDVFPVDTHVHRLCTRLGLAPEGTNPEKTYRLMKDLIPSGKGHTLHTNLIRFGRTVCRSGRPLCGACPLYSLCEFDGKGVRAGRRSAPSGTDHDFMLLDNV